MLARLTVLALALVTLAGCYVAPAPPPRYGYYRPYYGYHYGYYRPYGWRGW
jgi:hypothetical protein